MASLLCSARAVAQCQRLVAARSASTNASPIQSLFVNKIREYESKEKSAEHGLVGATRDDLKTLKDEEYNLQRRYGELDTSSLGPMAAASMEFTESVFEVDPLKEFDPFQRMKGRMPKVGETDNFMLQEVKLPEFLKA
eukprot:scpid101306/ scgid30776/ 